MFAATASHLEVSVAKFLITVSVDHFFTDTSVSRVSIISQMLQAQHVDLQWFWSWNVCTGILLSIL
jgi:hypothetical protein